MSVELTAGPPRPEVSVLIPVRNGAAVIEGQLLALSRQDFTGVWEVVVADNGSTDRTRAVVESWADRLPALTVVDASARTGVNPARNAAARRARGPLLLFTDADDEVSPSWVSAMVEVLGRTGLATGPAEQFDVRGRELSVLMAHGPATSLGFLPFALGCNLGVRREVFDEVGGFDEDWPSLGSDDIDFCWRAQRSGAELGFSPAARVRYRQPSTLRGAFAKQRSYGMGSAVLARRYGPHGARPWTNRDLFRDSLALARDLPWLLSIDRRMAWVRRAGWVAGLHRGLRRPGADPARSTT